MRAGLCWLSSEPSVAGSLDRLVEYAEVKHQTERWHLIDLLQHSVDLFMTEPARLRKLVNPIERCRKIRGRFVLHSTPRDRPRASTASSSKCSESLIASRIMRSFSRPN